VGNTQRGGSEPAIRAAIDGPATETGPRGIGGWLLVVALGQLVSPLQLIVALGQYYLDPENLKVFGQFPLAMYGELVMDAILLVLVATTAVLFFRKSRYFPRFFITELLAVIGLTILISLWTAVAFSIESGAPISALLEVERQDVVQFCSAVVVALIWIPYILKSRRVKNTFVDKSPALHDEFAARTASTAPSETGLLLAVVCTVFAMGLIGIVTGLGHLIGRGAFSGQLIGGALHIALGIWLFRGSDVARIILAFLFALGLFGFVAIAFLVANQGLVGIAAMLALAVTSAACLWALIVSKRFRAELAINAARYRGPEPEEA
jgi:hypothetical protein